MAMTGSTMNSMLEDTSRVVSCGQCRSLACRSSETDCTSTRCSVLWQKKKMKEETEEEKEEEEEEGVERERGDNDCGERGGSGSGSGGDEQSSFMELGDRRRQHGEQQIHHRRVAVVSNFSGDELESGGEREEEDDDVDEEERGDGGSIDVDAGGIFTPRFRRRAEEAGWDEDTLLMGLGSLEDISGGVLFPSPVNAGVRGRRWRGGGSHGARNKEPQLGPGSNEDEEGHHATFKTEGDDVRSPRAMVGAATALFDNGIPTERDRERKREARTPGLARTPASVERRHRRMRRTTDDSDVDEESVNAIDSRSGDELRRMREGCDSESVLESQRNKMELGRRLQAIQASRRTVLEGRAEERIGENSSAIAAVDSCELRVPSPTSAGEEKDVEKECVVEKEGKQQGGVDGSDAVERNCELSCLDQLRQELSCAVCLDICVEPSTTTCGHSFCSVCLRSSIQRCGPKCPKCRHPLGGEAALHCPVNTVLWNTIQLLFPEVTAEVAPRKPSTIITSRGNQLSSLMIPTPHPFMQMLPSNGRGRLNGRGLARVATHLVTGEDHALHSFFAHNTPRLRTAGRAPPNNPFREPRSAQNVSMPSTLVTSESHRPSLHSVSLRRGGSNIGPIPSSVVGNTRVVPDRAIEEDDESEGDDMDLFSGGGRHPEANLEVRNPVRARVHAFMQQRRRSDRADERHDHVDRLDALILSNRLQRTELARDDDSPPSPSLSSPSSLPQVLITSASAAAASSQSAASRTDSSRSAVSSRSTVGQTPQLRHSRHP